MVARDLDRGDAARHRSHHGNIAGARMLCGCIDIGTNTTRVLVAEARPAGLREVLQRRAFTRLGRGLAPGGTIPAARIAETAGVVAEQHALAEQAGASTIRAVATAVIRRAVNRDEFCAPSATTAASRSACSTARRRRGWPSSAPRGRSAARCRARRGRRRGRRVDRDRGGDAGRRRRVVGLVRVRLGLPGRRLPGRRPARPRRAARGRMHAARGAQGHRPRPGRHRDRGRGQRGVAAAAGGRDARRAEPHARAGASPAVRPPTSRRASTSTPSASG